MMNLKNNLLITLEAENVGRTMVLLERVDVETQTKGP